MSISAIISDYLKKKGITQQALAEKLGVERQYVNQKLKRKNDLNTDIIMRISIALEHDFFYDLSKQLPKEIRRIPDVANISIVDTAILDLLKEKYPNVFK